MTPSRTFLAATLTCLLAPGTAFADLPPIYSTGGGVGMIIAGVVLAAGVVALGVWFVRRNRKPPGGTPA